MNEVKAVILAHAAALYAQGGSGAMTRDRVAAAADVAAGAVNYHWGDIATLREMVVSEGIRTKNPEIVMWGLCERIPAATRAPPHLKQKAAKLLMEPLT